MKLRFLSLLLLVPALALSCGKQGDPADNSGNPQKETPAAEPADHSVTILLAGDSTCCTWPESSAPKEGWGQNLADVLGDDAKVVNLALSGYSTKWFIEKGKWDELCAQIKEKDIVCIQFGHNDKSSSVEERRVDVPGYKANLLKMVADVQEKKGIPVLLTSIRTRSFDSSGKLKSSSLIDYTNTVREVSREQEIGLIDIEVKMTSWLQKLGDAGSVKYYMSDNTHLTHDGACEVAGMVAAGLDKLGLW